MNEFKKNLPSNLNIEEETNSNILISNKMYPNIILNISLNNTLPTYLDIENRFNQLNNQLNCELPLSFKGSDNMSFNPFNNNNDFSSIQLQNDLYFDPNNDMFSKEYPLNKKLTESEMDVFRFPKGARIFPMSPFKKSYNGNKFNTLEPDSDNEPEYPFNSEDM